MTASLLLLYIFGALAAQVAIGILIAGWRSRQAPAGLEQQLSDAPPPAVAMAWAGWRQFRVDSRVFEDAAQTQCSFHLRPADGMALPPFEPGQFLTVRLPIGDNISGGSGQSGMIVRCYSLSDRPIADYYRLTIKRVLAPFGRPELPPGRASSYLHDRVEVGNLIDIKAPAGQFILARDALIPAALIAGGVGITPMVSMLRWSLDNQPDRPIHLYYGVRNGREHAFKDLLRQLSASNANFHLTVVYSDPAPDDVRGRDFEHAGHIDLDLLRRTLPVGRHQFYVCGPPPMMASLLPGLHAGGVASTDIHFEAFGPASARSALGASSGLAPILADPIDITFRRSGRTLSWDGQDANLLDFAERHGIAVESGCRFGSCGSCETTLVSGVVRYAQTPDHKIAAGCCLLCVSAPVSALLLEA